MTALNLWITPNMSYIQNINQPKVLHLAQKTQHKSFENINKLLTKHFANKLISNNNVSQTLTHKPHTHTQQTLIKSMNKSTFLKSR